MEGENIDIPMMTSKNDIESSEFLNSPTNHTITYTNISQGRMFFNRIHTYLSKQLFYVETIDDDNFDKNIQSISCCKTKFADDENKHDMSDNVNQTYDILSINFQGKDLCNVDTRITDMNITLKYKIPTKICKKAKNHLFINRADDLIVEYTITSKKRKFTGKSITETHVTEYNEITFVPVNKKSLKYFDLFISSIMNNSRKKSKNYMTTTTELTVYINIESYWEELLNRPTRSIDSVYLPKEDKQKIIKDIEWFLSNETQLRYEQLGRNYKRVLLFEGVPGSGKTSLALAIASHFGYDLAIISFTDKVSDGAFTRLIRQMPEKTILLLEDIDCLFHERKNHDNQKNDITFSGILNTLDGIATPHEFVCIITTNYKNLLDDALLRQGRVDTCIKFDYVKREQLKDIYKVYMGCKYSQENFKSFFQAYKDLGQECTVSLVQEYLFKYLDNPEKALENIEEIKQLKDSSTVKKANVYT